MLLKVERSNLRIYFFLSSRWFLCSLSQLLSPSHLHKLLLLVVLLHTSSHITSTLTTPTTLPIKIPPSLYHHLLHRNTHCYRLLQHAILNGTRTHKFFLLSCFFCCSSSQAVSSTLHEQLQSLAITKSSDRVVHIALVVCALCTTSTSQTSIDLLPTIAKLDPTLVRTNYYIQRVFPHLSLQAPSLLSFCVHSLSKADLLPAHELSLLYTLPDLAVDTLSAELVAAIVFTLSPPLYPLAVRLMCKACQKQVRILRILFCIFVCFITGLSV